MVEEDDAATALTQLPKLKAENKAFTALKESSKKSKVDVDTKFELLLQDKADLKKLHSEAEAELKKVNGTTSKLTAQKDTMTSKWDRLEEELKLWELTRWWSRSLL